MKQKKSPTESQSDKFKQVARDVGADGDEGTLDQALRKMKQSPDKVDKDEPGLFIECSGMDHIVHRCDSKHILLCVGERCSYLVWERVAILDLPDRLARLDNFKGVVVDEVAVLAK